MAKIDDLRQSVQGKQQQLDEIRRRLPLLSNPEFMAFQEARRRHLDNCVWRCTHQALSEYELGGLQGAISALEDLCMSREEAEERCRVLEVEIRDLQASLGQAQDRSYREPPPGVPPPPVPKRSPPPGYPERMVPPGMYPESGEY